MDCTKILNIVGDIASIITVFGGGYGLYTWCKSRWAKIRITEYERSDQCLFMIVIVNEGPADAYNVKISSASRYKIETSQYISKLQPGEAGQIGFAFRGTTKALPLYLHWTDKMGRHKKKQIITHNLRVYR